MQVQQMRHEQLAAAGLSWLQQCEMHFRCEECFFTPLLFLPRLMQTPVTSHFSEPR